MNMDKIFLISHLHRGKQMNEKINNFLQAIIIIAEKENTAESNAIKEIAIEISNILNKEDKN